MIGERSELGGERALSGAVEQLIAEEQHVTLGEQGGDRFDRPGIERQPEIDALDNCTDYVVSRSTTRRDRAGVAVVARHHPISPTGAGRSAVSISSFRPR